MHQNIEETLEKEEATIWDSATQEVKERVIQEAEDKLNQDVQESIT